jgi:heme-degrading monooxygenase HmoA
MIARFWRGITSKSKADEYFEYLKKTGLKDYGSTEGNRGVYVFRRLEDDHAVFLLVSLWESYDAIKKFAGPDFEKAVYYPEDKKFLLEMEPNVVHYEILAQPE